MTFFRQCGCRWSGTFSQVYLSNHIKDFCTEWSLKWDYSVWIYLACASIQNEWIIIQSAQKDSFPSHANKEKVCRWSECTKWASIVSNKNFIRITFTSVSGFYVLFHLINFLFNSSIFVFKVLYRIHSSCMLNDRNSMNISNAIFIRKNISEKSTLRTKESEKNE